MPIPAASYPGLDSNSAQTLKSGASLKKDWKRMQDCMEVIIGLCSNTARQYAERLPAVMNAGSEQSAHSAANNSPLRWYFSCRKEDNEIYCSHKNAFLPGVEQSLILYQILRTPSRRFFLDTASLSLLMKYFIALQYDRYQAWIFLPSLLQSLLPSAIDSGNIPNACHIEGVICLCSSVGRAQPW